MIGKHYYYFGEYFNEQFNRNSEKSTQLDKTNWDKLRIAEINSPFSIEQTVQEYEENCIHSESYINTATQILNEIRENEKIISLGIGKGILEWNIKHLSPFVTVDGCDYTEQALEKLKKVWTDHNRLFVFDMLNDDWNDLKNYDWILMHRLSTEFSKKNWKTIFMKAHEAGIQNAIFIPTGLENWKTILGEKINHIKHFLLGKKDVFCGWYYSENEFTDMWSGYYQVVKSISHEKNNKIYFLKRIDNV